MIKKILKLLTATRESTLADEAKKDFINDYTDKKYFIEKFRSHIAPGINDFINAVIDCPPTESHSSFDNSIVKILGNLRLLYTALWLEETNYGDALALKMDQLIYRDDYGDTNLSQWDKELFNFTKNHLHALDAYLKKTIPEKYITHASKSGLEHILSVTPGPRTITMQEVIQDAADDISIFLNIYYDHLLDTKNLSDLENITDPYAFELAVSEELSLLGWDSRTTSGSGDQGADVIAEKNGIRLVAQCKLYSSPVGNKAVQEVAAAKIFYRGDIAIVITNNEYTKSAMQLAESLDVYLIHHSQIRSFDELIFEESDPNREIDN